MHWLDAHLDLAYLAVNGRDLTVESIDPTVGCISLPALRAAQVRSVCGTIFTEPRDAGTLAPEMYLRNDLDGAETAGHRQLAIYEHLHSQGEISLMDRAGGAANSGMQLCILMENADPIRSPEHVEWWVQRGLRIVGLTWATGSRYAGGNSSEPGEGPLTPLGREMVRALDQFGVIHDVSHLSDAAFDGLMEHAQPKRAGMIIASHSNCRALVDDRQRHLRDDQIKAIGDRGGVIGLNLYSSFLAVGRRATLDDCVRHVEHICEIMGHRRGVGLGSDMDGGFAPDKLPIGCEGPAQLGNLLEAFSRCGWSREEIAGFAHLNFSRILAIGV